MSTSIENDKKLVRGVTVEISDNTLSVDLNDGWRIGVPLVWFPGLKQGNSDERKNWRLIGFGEGIHWEDLDEDINVEDLLAGKSSAESENSFKKRLQNRVDRAKTV
jgi:hypothetical protein